MSFEGEVVSTLKVSRIYSGAGLLHELAYLS